MIKTWQSDPLLRPVADDIFFADRSLTELSTRHGTPLYVYSAGRVRENVDRLRSALATTDRPFTIRFAMKCNRYGPVLDLIRAERDIGIDACSPREVELALSHGFRADEISVTAGNLCNDDLRVLTHRGIHLNSDTASVARRYAAAAPTGARLSFGLRLDPPKPLDRAAGEKLNYVGSKFGIAPIDLQVVYKSAIACGLDVDTLHVHCGWAMQEQHADAFDAAMATLAETARMVPGIRRINVGGGLAHPHHAADQPMTIDIWAEILRRHFASLPVHLECEIGTYIMANAGLLLMEVNTVESRRGRLWAGVDAGHAVNVYPYHYGIPLEIIPVNAALELPVNQYQIGSNINEAADMIGRDVQLPQLDEGDLLAMYCTGAYGSAMQSDHCLRGNAAEVLV